MQHIVHIFVGKQLVDFRNKFAASYRRLHSDHEQSLFAAVTLTEDEAGNYIISPDENGDALDGITVENETKAKSLYNFFDDMYRRKVTVAHPGNNSMTAVIWAKLFLNDSFDIIRDLTASMSQCSSNFHIEVSGFTHDAVSCFIAKPSERKSPDTYKTAFEKNVERLRSLRNDLQAIRLITNRNMNNVSLDFDEDAMARICAEHAAVMCEHYPTIHRTVIDAAETPFESFGISSIQFDVDYYKAYIKDSIIVDKMEQQGIDSRCYNINALAQKTNPILSDILSDIHDFKDRQAAHANALLSISGNATTSNVVGTMNGDIKDIIGNLEKRIHNLLASGNISIFECEALLSLILGEDSPLFESSPVNADELTLDDIIDKGAVFFENLESSHTRLREVSHDEIKRIRERMRNIAAANRDRKKRLNVLNIQPDESYSGIKHLDGNGYNFGGTEYKVNLNIDREPLAQTYQPHDVSSECIDLSNRFAPVRDQGKQGSCAAFAIASVVESMRHDSRRYSPAFLYWSAREIKNATSIDSGTSMNDIIKAAQAKGVCTEENMPYHADSYALAPSEAASKEALDCMVVEAKTVEPRLRDIKSALADGYPVIIAAKIFDSFSDTFTGFISHPSREEQAENSRYDDHGHHAMVVCGFSDKERILIVRNSWGKSFGKDGYCYMPYSYATRYLLQACIITKVSSADATKAAENGQTINFNLNDRNIEAAVLKNLIEEDNYELQALAEDSNRLRSDWTHNIALLGNVNNQAEIVNESKQKIDTSIFEENSTISHLQATMSDKLWHFKKEKIHTLITAFCVMLGAWAVVYFIPSSAWAWGIAIFVSLVTLILFSDYSYSWRKRRQELRDEIQRHANHINYLRQKKTDLDVLAHIYGTVLRETERYRLNLYSQFQVLRRFNQSWIDLYDHTQKELKNISPHVPYPFLTVLENTLLDRYYKAWRSKLLTSMNLQTIFYDFTQHDDLSDIITENAALNQSVMRGLRGFSMKEYVTTRNNVGKWQFLPDSAKVSEVIPELDARAIPFCPYNNPNCNATEKYIFIKDITQAEMKDLARYFAQKPMSVTETSPYSITILNTLRYNL